MDGQSPLRSLGYNPDDMSVLRWANLLMPTDTFSTIVRHFPGTNAHAGWAPHGDFFISFIVYVKGKEIGRYHTNRVDENGHIEVSFDDLVGFDDEARSGVIIAEYHHHKRIYPELYFAHIHRETGAYVAYPSQTFMGDQIYLEAHATELETALFWPGTGINPNTEVSLVVINPFDVSSFSQLSIFLPNGRREQNAVVKIPPRTHRVFKLEETFADRKDLMASADGLCSFCISSQYKLVAVVMFTDRTTGAVTTIDHLHKYCMY